MSLVNKPEDFVEEIRNFLFTHPDFFRENPDLLRKINIPHISNQDVTSLIEYQVHNLKNQITALERELQRSQELSNINSIFIEDVLSYSLKLSACQTIEELNIVLKNGLKQFFSADWSVLKLFSKSGASHFVISDDPTESTDKLRYMFTELFHRDKPLCDSLQDEHLRLIFGKEAGNINSSVLLTIHGHDWQGLMALGSTREDAYCVGAELDMLSYVSKIIEQKLRALFSYDL